MKTNNRSILLLIVVTISILSCNNTRKDITNDAARNFEAPEATKQGLLILNSRACYFDDADSIMKKKNITIENPSQRETEQINSIIKYTGLPQNFKIYRGDVDNALATVVNNQRLIIYNKDFFSRMDAIASSYWSSMFIIAHEIGHHLAANISDTGNALDAELQADIFAGSILYGMGADSNQVIAVFASNFLSDARDSKTHPSKYKRIAAVKKSWLDASQLRFQSAIPPPVHDHFSQAVGKPFLTDGSGATTTGFDGNALVKNRWVRDNNKMELVFVNRHTDSSDQYQIIETGSANYQGIILDVQKRRPEKGCEDMLFFEIEVLITKVDTASNYTGLQVNTKNRFLVCLDTNNGFVMKNGPAEFFSGGRRFEFDLLDIQNKEKTGDLPIISRADAL